MTQPNIVQSEILKLHEQQQYEASQDSPHGSRRGRLWFRNCHTGCEFMGLQQITDHDILSGACRDCELIAAPTAWTRRALHFRALPESALDVAKHPFWLVSGAHIARALSGQKV